MSLVEVAFTATILLVMVYAVTSLTMSGTDAQEYSRRLNRATEVNQDILDQLRLELISSVRLFGNDAEGLANLDAMDLAGAPPPLADSRLPTTRSSGTFQKDTVTSQITGNRLLFARHAWTDRFVCSSGREYLTDVVRWVQYYLCPEAGGPRPGRAHGLNLVRVFGEPLADGGQIDRITDATDRAELLLHLLAGSPDANGVSRAPVELVWVRGGMPAAAGTFRQIVPATGALSLTPLTPRGPDWTVRRRQQTVTGMLSFRHHSVATNHARTSTGVGRYGLTSSSGAGFPHGFEVQIVGPSSARQILLHLVLTSTNNRGQVAWSDLQLMVDARDT